MYKKRFVFVLGAGASNDFGYPTGSRLIEIISKYKNDGPFVEFMKNFGFSGSDIEIFVNGLKKSGLNSIDAFLTRVIGLKREQPIDFEGIGRACITYAILYHEKQSKDIDAVFRFDNNWCRHLAAFLNDDYLALMDGRVKFLTFNYDLSLECFLGNSYKIRNYLHAMSKDELGKCLEQLKKIEIIHLYGKVGNLIEFDGNGRIYGTDMLSIYQWREFQQITKGIEIVRPQETNETQASFQKAQEFLKQADYIFFLGFGFDPLNMERLGLHDVFQQDIDRRQFYVTAYMADNSSIYDFENRVFHGNDKAKVFYQLGKKDEKIVSFLKDNCFVLSQLGG